MSYVAFAAGKSEIKSWSWKSYSHSEHLRATFCLCRPNAPTDTLRRVSSVHIRPTQTYRGCVYEHIPLLWCANITRGSNQTVFLSANSAGDVCARFRRVLVDDVLGVEVGGRESQNSDNYGNHRGGFGVLLLGYIHLPPRARDDLAFWTGKCDRPSPFRAATGDA